MVPFYEMILSEEGGGGIEAISLVDFPAMESVWMKLAKEKSIYQTLNKEKRILFGPLLIPNKPILRISETGEQFYIVFSRETIEKIRNKYFKSGTNKFNLQHEENILVNGTMIESFISGGVIPAPDQYKDLPDGTWYASLKIEDDAVWNRFIATNVFNGFSIEGNFKPQPILNMDILDKFEAYLKTLIN
jgi:hypothetical protein